MKKAIKKALSVMLVVVIMLTATPLSGFVGLKLPDLLDFSINANAATSGACGESLTWNFDRDTGTLTISGFGPMRDCSTLGDAPWDDISNEIKNLIINYGVTTVGEGAFFACQKLKNVELPNSLVSIGDVSFYGSPIKDLIIPDSVITIGISAFATCPLSGIVVLGNGLKTIGERAFENAGISSVNIPDSVEEIGYCAFFGSSLKSLTIGNGFTKIESRAFSQCDNLTTVTIGDNVTSIGQNAFYGSEGIEEVNINSLVSWCNIEFSNSSSNPLKYAELLKVNGTPITSLKMPSDVTTIKDYSFYGYKGLEKVIIDNDSTVIGSYSFASCDSLLEATIGGENTTFESYAFNYCTGLLKVSICAGVKAIGDYAFYGCADLLTVNINESVKTVADNAFMRCWNISDVYYSSTEAKWNTINFGPANDYLLNATIHFNSVCDDLDEEEHDSPEENKYYILGRKFDENIDYYTKHLDSYKYDATLSNMMMALSSSAYSKNAIESAYISLGFTNYGIYDYNEFDTYRCGYSIALKDSEYDNDKICIITFRGSELYTDWVGDFEINTDNEKHLGFYRPAETVYEHIKTLIVEGFTSDNVKYFITGHSRGAAVANLLSVELMENGVAAKNIYNYNFACPDVACKNYFPSYYNIFNLCNRADPVPSLLGALCNAYTSSGTSWGKFGQTYWFTNFAENTENIFSGHGNKVYLNFFDQKLNISDWPQDEYDEYYDILYKEWGWVTRISCPVDVIVSDKTGKNIASVTNGEINYYDSKFGGVIIFTDGDKKIIYTNGDKDFNVELIGTDTGTMTYSIEKYNLASGEISESKTFDNVALADGKTMYSPVSEAEQTKDIQLFVTEEKNGELVYTHIINEDGVEETYYTFSIQTPSTTTIRHKDGIILHLDIEGKLPENSKIKWYVSNDNFDAGYLDDGMSCMFISKNNGYTTIYAVLVDENGNELVVDSIIMRSKAGFFDKIGSFFRSLFGGTKIYEN